MLVNLKMVSLDNTPAHKINMIVINYKNILTLSDVMKDFALGR